MRRPRLPNYPIAAPSPLECAPLVFVLLACSPADDSTSDDAAADSTSTDDGGVTDDTGDGVATDDSGDGDGDTTGDGDDDTTGDGDDDTTGDGDGDTTGDGDGDTTGDGDGDTTGDGDGDGGTWGEPVPDCSEAMPCTGSTLWSRAITGPMTQRGLSVTTVGDRVFAVGFTTDTVVTDDLPDLVELDHDLVVFELDAVTGTVLWARTITGYCASFPRITASAEQVLVLGFCSGDVDVAGVSVGDFPSNAFVVGRFTLDGTVTGADGFGTTVQTVGTHLWITTDESGAYALITYFAGSINFGLADLHSVNGIQDMVVAVFEADGTPRWSRRFGDSAIQLGHTGEFAPNGDLVVFGTNQGVIDFGGNPLGEDGLAVARLDANTGQPVWSTLYPGSGGGYAAVSAASPSGIVVATRGGMFTPPTVLDFGNGELSGHALVAGLDYDGELQWQRSFESQSNQAGLGLVYGVAVDEVGSVVLVGHGIYPVDLGLGVHVPAGRDGFVLKLDADGDPTDWVRWAGDWNQQSHDQFLEGVAVDDAGAVYVVGSFSGHVNLGDQELIAQGEDMLIVALEP